MTDPATTLVIGGEASKRLTAMVATWQVRHDKLQSELYVELHAAKALDVLPEIKAIAEFDRSVINALLSMIRLGSAVYPDNQDPPSLIVDAERITYGVSVLRQLGMQWSVDT